MGARGHERGGKNVIVGDRCEHVESDDDDDDEERFMIRKGNHRMERRRRHGRGMRDKQRVSKRMEKRGGRKKKGFKKCQDRHGIIRNYYSLFQIA